MTETAGSRVSTRPRGKRVRHPPGYRSSTIISSELDTAPLQSRPWLARMEYLYKLSHLLPFHSQHYLKRMLGIAAMTTLRLDPSIKGTICKRCKYLLIPHQTATLSVYRRAPQLQCLNCGAMRILAQTKKSKALHEAHRSPQKSGTQGL
ncbi:Ribonuclease P [Giardia duodenalis]|uniref:Ribonuclease P n=1 Tax=Giardia intestinalis (strain ATCC 50803 / WB clone C6) TaxID=184922 RepID=A0A644FA75_GIAIC|nr:Ribonuclease P [Giardia intestinalis]KAE8305508.1 Ribonuclease P [Giardia intestinalis]